MVIVGAMAAVALAGPAPAQDDGGVVTEDPAGIELTAPATAAPGEPTTVSAFVVKGQGTLVVRAQRRPCRRTAGRLVMREAVTAEAQAFGRTFVPRRRTRYRLCARVRTTSGAILRAERTLRVR
jgi:hypothetical protein